MDASLNKSEVTSFRDLRVWKAGMDLVEQVYQITRGFPLEELYGLTGQMRRAAVSIPSNIAEGRTREHVRVYLHHLAVAQGSLAELETQVEIAKRLRYCSPAEGDQILRSCASLAKQIYSLRNSLSRKRHPDSQVEPQSTARFP
jgi:four helix bundle protein